MHPVERKIEGRRTGWFLGFSAGLGLIEPQLELLRAAALEMSAQLVLT